MTCLVKHGDDFTFTVIDRFLIDFIEMRFELLGVSNVE